MADRAGRAGRVWRVVALAAGVALLGPAAPRVSAGHEAALDPGEWPTRQLAAQLVVASVSMSNLGTAESWARDGLGGVVLLGQPPSDLRTRLARLRAAAAVPPFVMSDEEGGQVQRLAPLIYRLPSAEWQGRNRTPDQVRRTAYDYGRRMRALGVDVALSPVADLAIPGYYIERSDRGFSADPSRAAAYAVAWHEGMRAARVAAVAKHWPGHGQATDTHAGAATTPHLSTLERRDLVPFARLTSAGVPMVMVGHLNVPGLTEPNTPASLSPAAMRYLRARLGPARLVLTDSLSMRAVTSALGISAAEAAYRALKAGADVALLDGDPGAAIQRIEQAITRGEYARSAAVASARRVLAAKRFTDVAREAFSGAGGAPAGGSAAYAAHVGLGGAVLLRRVDGTRWSAPTDLGGGSAHPPAVTRAGHRLYVFVRGGNGYVYSRFASGGAWTAWTRLDATATGAPAAAGHPDGSIDLAVRDVAGRLVVRRYLPNSGWSAPSDLGATTTDPAIAATADGAAVAAVDGSGVVVRARGPLGWDVVGTTAGGATVRAPALAYDGGLTVAVAGADGRLWVASRTGANWSGWMPLGGLLSAAPALVARADGTLLAIVRGGAANALYTKTRSGGRWSTGFAAW